MGTKTWQPGWVALAGCGNLLGQQHHLSLASMSALFGSHAGQIRHGLLHSQRKMDDDVEASCS